MSTSFSFTPCHVVYATDTFNCGLWGSMLTLLAHATCDVHFHVVHPAGADVRLPTGVNATTHTMPKINVNPHSNYVRLYSHPSSYARLWLPYYLDPSVHTALYLDTDTLIDGNIAELFISERSAKTISMKKCGDVGSVFVVNGAPIRGVDPQQPIYCSGQFVANIHEWRARNWTARMLKLATSDELNSNDDMIIMNVVAARDDAIAELPERWGGPCLGCNWELSVNDPHANVKGIHHWCCGNKWWLPDGDNHRYALRLIHALPTNDSMCVLPFREFALRSLNNAIELDAELHAMGLLFLLVIAFICVVTTVV